MAAYIISSFLKQYADLQVASLNLDLLRRGGGTLISIPGGPKQLVYLPGKV